MEKSQNLLFFIFSCYRVQKKIEMFFLYLPLCTYNLLFKFMDSFSVFVPRVHHSVDWRTMKEIFEQVFGTDSVSHVKILAPRDQDTATFSKAYVHFNNKVVQGANASSDSPFTFFKKKLLDGESVKIVYQDPHYWLCILNKAVRKTPERKGPYLQYESAEEMPEKENTVSDA